MKAKFSIKKTWISTSAWRGYEKPIYAVCGANDTGTWSDSPCPSNVASSELWMARQELRAAGIPTKEVACKTSNVFCVARYIIVPPDKFELAKEIMKSFYENARHETRLLYIES